MKIKEGGPPSREATEGSKRKAEKKLRVSASFLKNGGLILDEGKSGARADFMDPGRGGDPGLGLGGVVRGQNRST